MNALTLLNNQKWNPFQGIDELNRRWHQVFFGDCALDAGATPEVRLRDWSPLVDITENDAEYLLKVELPEVAREDISVRVEDGVLLISGERKAETVKNEKKLHRVERAYGKFVRSFQVPENAEASKVTAQFKEGILRVALPKVAEAKSEAIEIAVA